MRRLLVALAVCITWASTALGQTTVNLAVTDTPDNQTWNNGTWAVQLIPGPGSLDQTRNFTLLVAGGSLASQSGSLSATGTASFSLPANVNIGPSGTKWQFNVCSQQATACSIANITITTSSPQSVTISPPSIRVASQPNLPPILVYTTTEISSAAIGSQITVVGSVPTTPSLQTCTVVSGNNCTTWAGTGNVPGQFNVKTYGAVGDAKLSITTTLTNTQNTITDTANPFLASDVGKFIFCIFPGDGTTRLAVGTKISTFVSAGSITVSANATGTGAHNCVWYTQKETSAFVAAGVAAQASLIGGVQGGTTTSSTSTVICPPGGYVFDGAFIRQHLASLGQGVNFIGSGPRNSCHLFQSPDITSIPVNNAYWADISQVDGIEVANLEIDCFTEAINLVSIPFRFQNVIRARIHDITLNNCGNQGDANGMISLLGGGGQDIVEQVYMNTGSTGNVEPAIGLVNVSTTQVRNVFTTNPGTGPSIVVASGGHNQTGGFNTIIGGIFDEGSTPGAISVTTGADVLIQGATAFAGVTNELNVDGTSTVRLDDVNFIPFSGSCGVGQTRNAITIASGGIVTATNSTLQGCGATGAISGPAGATFVDIGGNDIRNCPAAGGQNPCALVTPATFATLGYTGGIVPKSTQTHTPNTCYANTGNLLATAQNICTLLLDQNYQLINIAAQSGGTTPASSSCATPPVITLSDGTRSETMQMTSGQTVWCSTTSGTCTASTVTNPNQIFASGTLLTVSIGTSTCVTPPSNVSVNYVLQSALNP